MKKVTSILITMLLLCFPAYSQDESLTDSQTEQKSERIEIFFDLGSYVIDPTFSDNQASLIQLADMIERLQGNPLNSIAEIKIDSYASPDGGRHYNEQITKNRTNSLYNYLVKTLSVPDSLITKKSSGIDWNGLYSLVETSDMQYRDEVLDIIENTPEETWRKVNPEDRWMTLTDSRVRQLQNLKYGNPYRYLNIHFFPQLRVGSVVTIYYKIQVEPVITEKIESLNIVTIEDNEVVQQIETLPTEKLYPKVGEITEVKAKNPIRFAVKTNLLYDILLVPSLELEVPIGNHWSIAGECVFPWWTWDNGAADSKRHRMQLLQGNLMGKYWFGNRTNKPQLTGWFAGVYVGAGLYDFEYNKEGIQGEFFIAGGIAGGYAHTINKSGNLRMEYSLGVGYLQTDYRSYTSEYYGKDDWRAVRTQSGSYTWIGPTQLKVSLVWMLNSRVKTRGGVR